MQHHDPKTAHMMRYNKELRREMQENKHEVCIISIENFDKMMQNNFFMRHSSTKQETWQSIRKKYKQPLTILAQQQMS